eukprot:SAG11_NODE_20527_length_443_cov_1.223837_1_plen_147_part_11
MGSLLTAMVGIGWSKDNEKTVGCAHGEGAGLLGMLLATLSLGPVGVTDPLSEGTLPGPWAEPAWPANTTITSNVSIVKAAISLNGTLLQPSYPITPTAATLQRLPSAQGGWSVWATHTSVACGALGGGTTAAICNHFTAVGFLDTAE